MKASSNRAGLTVAAIRFVTQKPSFLAALKRGEFFVDLGDHLPHARLGEYLFADRMLTLEVRYALLEDS